MKIKRRKLNVEVPNMAMGDIAFNLLVFFVILAQANDDSHLKWQPAQASELESAGASRVSIVIDKDDKLYLNGNQISESQIADGVAEILGDAPAGERTVLLKVHKDSTALRFEPVIEGISEAGGDLVHILEDERSKK